MLIAFRENQLSMKIHQLNPLVTLSLLSLFVVLLVATQTTESTNWTKIILDKVQQCLHENPAYVEEWKAEIKKLKARMTQDDLERMSLLVSCVDLKRPISKLNEIYESIPEAVLVSSLTKLMRFEMAIVYAFKGEISQIKLLQTLALKVVSPCEQVHQSIRKWWKKFKIRTALTRSQLEWLRLETICNGIISKTKDHLAQTIHSKLWAQNEINYMQQNADPSWFSERIPEALEPTIASRSGQVLSMIVDSVAEECETDFDRKNLHKTLPIGVLAKVSAKIDSEATTSRRPAGSKLRQRAQVACKYVHIVLQRWWQDNYRRENLTKQDLKWLTIENICQNILAGSTTTELACPQAPEEMENLECDC